MALTLREEIALAVQIGFTEAGGRVEVRHEDLVHGDMVTGTVTLLDVDGYDEPIAVYANDVRIPDCFPPEIAAGIDADVRTILAELEDSAFTEPDTW
jgi:hypothetical protein